MNKIGEMGEIAAANYLKEKGYKIIKLNYTCRHGEIDIIAQRDEYIIFVEVKTRSINALESGRAAVGITKQKKIITTAMLYLSEFDALLQPRFDIIEIITAKSKVFSVKEINHLENAFFVEETNAPF